MSNRVFVTADTHFGHLKAVTFRPYATVEEHDRDIIARWNSVVRPKDIVWHLGDVYFREGWKCLGQLNGRKKLVMGNHDTHTMDVYLANFDRVFGAVSYRDFLLTHLPCHPNQLQRWKLNIHGHMHANVVPDHRYRCVSLERTNYTPVLFDKVVEGFDEPVVQTSVDRPFSAGVANVFPASDGGD
jgi:calcineurin-like phosphoesterase family protein